MTGFLGLVYVLYISKEYLHFTQNVVSSGATSFTRCSRPWRRKEGQKTKLIKIGEGCHIMETVQGVTPLSIYTRNLESPSTSPLLLKNANKGLSIKRFRYHQTVLPRKKNGCCCDEHALTLCSYPGSGGRSYICYLCYSSVFGKEGTFENIRFPFNVSWIYKVHR